MQHHDDPVELNDQPLDDAFWARFADELWEQRPCVLRRAMPAGLASEAELMQALCEASHGDSRSDSSLRLYRGTAMEHGQHDALFPLRADASLDAWAARVRAELEGEGFLLALNGLQRFSRPLWHRARALLAPLASHLGHALEGVDVDAFVGWYDATPEGVHKDAASNFMLVTRGPKTMQLWPAGAFSDPGARRDELHATAQAAAREPGVTVEVWPGDVLYWPSSAWHVGLSPHGPTACINLPIYVEPRHHADLLAALRTALEADGPARAPQRAPGIEGLHAGVAADLARARALLDGARDDPDAPDVHDLLLDRRLRRRSADGFERVPPPHPEAPLPRGCRVVRHPGGHLAWARTRSGELLCAGQGHSLILPDHPALVALLERLESGASAGVDALVTTTLAALGQPDDEPTADVLRGLLATLVAWDALLVDADA